MGKLSFQIRREFARWGRGGGRKRAQRLNATQRSLIASHAARSRWHKKEKPQGVTGSVRLSAEDWTNPVYLEEVLFEGRLSEWQVLYRCILDFPFGPTAEALKRVLGSQEVYGATPLWRGILQILQGGVR